MNSNKHRAFLDLFLGLLGALPLLLLSLVGMSAGLWFHILMSQRLGPAVVGNYGLMLSVIQIVLLVILFGTNKSTVRLLAASYRDGEPSPSLRLIWTLVLPLCGCAAVLLAWQARFIAEGIFDTPSLTVYIRYAALILPVSALAAVWSAAHQGLRRVGLAVVIREVVPLSVASMVLWGWPYLVKSNDVVSPAVSYGLGWTVAAIVGGCAWFWFCRHGSKPLDYNFRSVVGMSWPMLLTSGSLLILGWTDTIMLGIYHDSATVGIYRTALKISLLTTLGAQSVRKLAAPRMAAAHAKGDGDEFAHWVKLTAWGNILAVWPLIIVTLVFPRELLGIFGEAFYVGVPALVILCCSEGVRSLFGMSGILLDMTGHQKKFRDATAVAASMNIVLNLCFVPRYGATGAAVATAISCTIGAMLACYFSCRRLRINPTVFRVPSLMP